LKYYLNTASAKSYILSKLASALCDKAGFQWRWCITIDI